MFKVFFIAALILFAIQAYAILYERPEFSFGMLLGIFIMCLWHRSMHGYWPLDSRPASAPPPRVID